MYLCYRYYCQGFICAYAAFYKLHWPHEAYVITVSSSENSRLLSENVCRISPLHPCKLVFICLHFWPMDRIPTLHFFFDPSHSDVHYSMEEKICRHFRFIAIHCDYLQPCAYSIITAMLIFRTTAILVTWYCLNIFSTETFFSLLKSISRLTSSCHLTDSIEVNWLRLAGRRIEELLKCLWLKFPWGNLLSCPSPPWKLMRGGAIGRLLSLCVITPKAVSLHTFPAWKSCIVLQKKKKKKKKEFN